MRHNQLIRRIARPVTALLFGFTLILQSAGPAAAQGNKLLPGFTAGVNATADVVANVVVDGGFAVTGTVTSSAGPVFAGSVTATSATESFSGPITFNPFAGGSTYRLIARAGVYTISVQIFVLDQATQSQATVSLDVFNGVAIASDRVVNITANPPPLFAVSGSAMNVGTLPNQGTVRFTTTDGKTSALTQLNGSYNLAVPAGTYTVGVILSINNGAANLFLYQTTVTITGAATVNLLLPAVFNVSGTLKNSTGGALTSSTFLASDSTRLTADATTGIVQIPSNSTTGAYTVPVPAGSYLPSTAMTINLGGNVQGTLTFGNTPSPFTVSAATTYNVVAPATPPLRRISGKVMGPGGVPGANAAVSVFSTSITGIPNASFGAGTTAGADGGYSIMVVSGTNYTVSALPAQ